MYRDLQHSQTINFEGTRTWRLRVISLIAFLIVVILVLVAVVAVTNKNKDAKIAEVDTNLRRQQKTGNEQQKTMVKFKTDIVDVLNVECHTNTQGSTQKL